MYPRTTGCRSRWKAMVVTAAAQSTTARVVRNREASTKPSQYAIVIWLSTAVTPGADQAARSAS